MSNQEKEVKKGTSDAKKTATSSKDDKKSESISAKSATSNKKK